MYESTVVCDRCGERKEAPKDGGFPEGWTEINRKPSFRGDQTEKRRRIHLCKDCSKLIQVWIDNFNREGTFAPLPK